jgi:polyphosphate kinase
MGDPISAAKNDPPDGDAKLNALTQILGKIPFEAPPRSKVELQKRQERGDYKETDYPFRTIPEIF